MNALDDFLTELRTATGDRGHGYTEVLEVAFHVLETSDSPLAIADRDRIASIASIVRRPLPLIARVHAVLMLLQEPPR